MKIKITKILCKVLTLSYMNFCGVPRAPIKIVERRLYEHNSLSYIKAKFAVRGVLPPNQSFTYDNLITILSSGNENFVELPRDPLRLTNVANGYYTADPRTTFRYRLDELGHHPDIVACLFRENYLTIGFALRPGERHSNDIERELRIYITNITDPSVDQSLLWMSSGRMDLRYYLRTAELELKCQITPEPMPDQPEPMLDRVIEYVLSSLYKALPGEYPKKLHLAIYRSIGDHQLTRYIISFLWLYDIHLADLPVVRVAELSRFVSLRKYCARRLWGLYYRYYYYNLDPLESDLLLRAIRYIRGYREPQLLNLPG